MSETFPVFVEGVKGLRYLFPTYHELDFLWSTKTLTVHDTTRAHLMNYTVRML